MRIKVKANGIDDYQKWLKNCQAGEVEAMKGRILRSVGIAGLKNVAANTPRRTSRLVQSLSVGATENYFKVEVSSGTSVVIYGTVVPYAEAVEKGYDQNNRVSKKTGKKPTLFVPGYWSSGTFHYVPGAKEGMVLTGRIVEGQHMFEKAQGDTEADAKQIILNEFKRLYGALF